MGDEDGNVTSEALAQRMSTDPAVVRRTMAGLREAGIVRSEKGHGGGWSLERPLERVTLRDVYEALGVTDLFAVGNRVESPGCLVEQAVNRTLHHAFGTAEQVLLTQLARTTLAEIDGDVKRQAARARRARRSKAAS